MEGRAGRRASTVPSMRLRDLHEVKRILDDADRHSTGYVRLSKLKQVIWDVAPATQQWAPEEMDILVRDMAARLCPDDAAAVEREVLEAFLMSGGPAGQGPSTGERDPQSPIVTLRQRVAPGALKQSVQQWSTLNALFAKVRREKAAPAPGGEPPSHRGPGATAAPGGAAGVTASRVGPAETEADAAEDGSLSTRTTTDSTGSEGLQQRFEATPPSDPLPPAGPKSELLKHAAPAEAGRAPAARTPAGQSHQDDEVTDHNAARRASVRSVSAGGEGAAAALDHGETVAAGGGAGHRARRGGRLKAVLASSRMKVLADPYKWVGRPTKVDYASPAYTAAVEREMAHLAGLVGKSISKCVTRAHEAISITPSAMSAEAPSSFEQLPESTRLLVLHRLAGARPVFPSTEEELSTIMRSVGKAPSFRNCTIQYPKDYVEERADLLESITANKKLLLYYDQEGFEKCVFVLDILDKAAWAGVDTNEDGNLDGIGDGLVMQADAADTNEDGNPDGIGDGLVMQADAADTIAVERERKERLTERMKHLLQEAGIVLRDWGVAACKSVSDLTEDICDDRVATRLVRFGNFVFRYMDAVSVLARRAEWQTEEGLRDFVVIESYEMSSSFTFRRRAEAPCQKRTLDEEGPVSTKALAQACAATEFSVGASRMKIRDQNFKAGEHHQWRPTQSYPGLLTLGLISTIRVEVSGLPPHPFRTIEASGKEHFWDWVLESAALASTDAKPFVEFGDEAGITQDDTTDWFESIHYAKALEDRPELKAAVGSVCEDWKKAVIHPIAGGMSGALVFQLKGEDRYGRPTLPIIAKTDTVESTLKERNRHQMMRRHLGDDAVPMLMNMVEFSIGSQQYAINMMELAGSRWYLPELSPHCRVTTFEDMYRAELSETGSATLQKGFRDKVRMVTSKSVRLVLDEAFRHTLNPGDDVTVTRMDILSHSSVRICDNLRRYILDETDGKRGLSDKIKDFLRDQTEGQLLVQEMTDFLNWLQPPPATSGSIKLSGPSFPEAANLFTDSFPTFPQHCDLNGGNLLVDSQNCLWVIDMAHALEDGLIFHDFAKMEQCCVIQYTPIGDLREFTQMCSIVDDLYSSQTPWTGAAPSPGLSVNALLLFNSVTQMRALAMEYMHNALRHGASMVSCALSYYVCLFFHYLKVLRYDDEETNLFRKRIAMRVLVKLTRSMRALSLLKSPHPVRPTPKILRETLLPFTRSNTGERRLVSTEGSKPDSKNSMVLFQLAHASYTRRMLAMYGVVVDAMSGERLDILEQCASVKIGDHVKEALMSLTEKGEINLSAVMADIDQSANASVHSAVRWALSEDAVQSNLLVVGQPASGKTVLLKQLLLLGSMGGTSTRDSEVDATESIYTPVLIILVEFIRAMDAKHGVQWKEDRINANIDHRGSSKTPASESAKGAAKQRPPETSRADGGKVIQVDRAVQTDENELEENASHITLYQGVPQPNGILDEYFQHLYGPHSSTYQHICASRKRKHLMVMLDGLDEVRVDALKYIVMIVENLRNEGLKVIVSTRPTNWSLLHESFSDGWDWAAILDLSPEMQNAMAVTRLLGKSDSFLAALRSRPDYMELAKSPLLLSMLMHIYKQNDILPRNRSQLYDACVKALLIALEKQKQKKEAINEADAMSLLLFIAHKLHIMKGTGHRDFNSEFAQTCDDECIELGIMQNPVWPKLCVLADAGRCPLLPVIGYCEYRFTHLTFQEYLAASFVCRDIHMASSDDLEMFVSHAGYMLMLHFTYMEDKLNFNRSDKFGRFGEDWLIQVFKFIGSSLSDQAFAATYLGMYAYALILLTSEDRVPALCKLLHDTSVMGTNYVAEKKRSSGILTACDLLCSDGPGIGAHIRAVEQYIQGGGAHPTLYFRDTSPEGQAGLVSGLAGCRTQGLEGLIIAGQKNDNVLGLLVAEGKRSGIESLRHVTTLSLFHCSISTDSLKDLMGSTGLLPHLKNIHLRHNDLDDEAALALISCFSNGAHLETIDLSDNNITSSANIFAFPSVKRMILSNNENFRLEDPVPCDGSLEELRMENILSCPKPEHLSGFLSQANVLAMSCKTPPDDYGVVPGMIRQLSTKTTIGELVCDDVLSRAFFGTLELQLSEIRKSGLTMEGSSVQPLREFRRLAFVMSTVPEPHPLFDLVRWFEMSSRVRQQEGPRCIEYTVPGLVEDPNKLRREETIPLQDVPAGMYQEMSLPWWTRAADDPELLSMALKAIERQIAPSLEFRVNSEMKPSTAFVVAQRVICAEPRRGLRLSRLRMMTREADKWYSVWILHNRPDLEYACVYHESSVSSEPLPGKNDVVSEVRITQYLVDSSACDRIVTPIFNGHTHSDCQDKPWIQRVLGTSEDELLLKIQVHAVSVTHHGNGPWTLRILSNCDERAAYDLAGQLLFGDRIVSRNTLEDITIRHTKETVPMYVGFSVDEPDMFGRRCLHLAVAKEADGCTGEVDRTLALSQGAVNARESMGRTPLHLAAERGLMSACKSLLEAGADAETLSCRGMSCVDYAAGRGHWECAVLIMEHLEANRLQRSTLKDETTHDSRVCTPFWDQPPIRGDTIVGAVLHLQERLCKLIYSHFPTETTVIAMCEAFMNTEAFGRVGWYAEAYNMLSRVLAGCEFVSSELGQVTHTVWYVGAHCGLSVDIPKNLVPRQDLDPAMLGYGDGKTHPFLVLGRDILRLNLAVDASRQPPGSWDHPYRDGCDARKHAEPIDAFKHFMEHTLLPICFDGSIAKAISSLLRGSLWSSHDKGAFLLGVRRVILGGLGKKSDDNQLDEYVGVRGYTISGYFEDVARRLYLDEIRARDDGQGSATAVSMSPFNDEWYMNLMWEMCESIQVLLPLLGFEVKNDMVISEDWDTDNEEPIPVEAPLPVFVFCAVASVWIVLTNPRKGVFMGASSRKRTSLGEDFAKLAAHVDLKTSLAKASPHCFTLLDELSKLMLSCEAYGVLESIVGVLENMRTEAKENYGSMQFELRMYHDGPREGPWMRPYCLLNRLISDGQYPGLVSYFASSIHGTEFVSIMALAASIKNTSRRLSMLGAVWKPRANHDILENVRVLSDVLRQCRDRQVVLHLCQFIADLDRLGTMTLCSGPDDDDEEEVDSVREVNMDESGLISTGDDLNKILIFAEKTERIADAGAAWVSNGNEALRARFDPRKQPALKHFHVALSSVFEQISIMGRERHEVLCAMARPELYWSIFSGRFDGDGKTMLNTRPADDYVVECCSMWDTLLLFKNYIDTLDEDQYIIMGKKVRRQLEAFHRMNHEHKCSCVGMSFDIATFIGIRRFLVDYDPLIPGDERLDAEAFWNKALADVSVFLRGQMVAEKCSDERGESQGKEQDACGADGARWSPTFSDIVEQYTMSKFDAPRPYPLSDLFRNLFSHLSRRTPAHDANSLAVLHAAGKCWSTATRNLLEKEGCWDIAQYHMSYEPMHTSSRWLRYLNAPDVDARLRSSLQLMCSDAFRGEKRIIDRSPFNTICRYPDKDSREMLWECCFPLLRESEAPLKSIVDLLWSQISALPRNDSLVLAQYMDSRVDTLVSKSPQSKDESSMLLYDILLLSEFVERVAHSGDEWLRKGDSALLEDFSPNKRPALKIFHGAVDALGEDLGSFEHELVQTALRRPLRNGMSQHFTTIACWDLFTLKGSLFAPSLENLRTLFEARNTILGFLHESLALSEEQCSDRVSKEIQWNAQVCGCLARSELSWSTMFELLVESYPCRPHCGLYAKILESAFELLSTGRDIRADLHANNDSATNLAVRLRHTRCWSVYKHLIEFDEPWRCRSSRYRGWWWREGKFGYPLWHYPDNIKQVILTQSPWAQFLKNAGVLEPFAQIPYLTGGHLRLLHHASQKQEDDQHTPWWSILWKCAGYRRWNDEDVAWFCEALDSALSVIYVNGLPTECQPSWFTWLERVALTAPLSVAQKVFRTLDKFDHCPKDVLSWVKPTEFLRRASVKRLCEFVDPSNGVVANLEQHIQHVSHRDAVSMLARLALECQRGRELDDRLGEVIRLLGSVTGPCTVDSLREAVGILGDAVSVQVSLPILIGFLRSERKAGNQDLAAQFSTLASAAMSVGPNPVIGNGLMHVTPGCFHAHFRVVCYSRTNGIHQESLFMTLSAAKAFYSGCLFGMEDNGATLLPGDVCERLGIPPNEIRTAIVEDPAGVMVLMPANPPVAIKFPNEVAGVDAHPLQAFEFCVSERISHPNRLAALYVVCVATTNIYTSLVPHFNMLVRENAITDTEGSGDAQDDRYQSALEPIDPPRFLWKGSSDSPRQISLLMERKLDYTLAANMGQTEAGTDADDLVFRKPLVGWPTTRWNARGHARTEPAHESTTLVEIHAYAPDGG